MLVRGKLVVKLPRQRAASLGYSVLPDVVRQKVLVKLAGVTCQGKQVATP